MNDLPLYHTASSTSRGQTNPVHPWLSWIAMLAFASILSPINIHIVIAQELPELVIASADPGEPPTPPQASAAPFTLTEAVATAPTEALNTATDPSTVDEPVPEVVPVQTREVPATSSEISSDTDIGKLLPNDKSLPDSIASEKPKVDRESVRTLSVEPGVRPMLPEDRPAWVGAASDFTSAQHFLYVGSLPTTNRFEVDEALDTPLVAAVRNYIDQEVVNQIGAADSMPVTAQFIRRNLIDNPEGYECELTTSQEPLFQKWVTVRITPEQRQLFRNWHTEAKQRTRLAPLGVGLVAVLSAISLSHVVLRQFRGTRPLPMVNQTLPAQVVSRRTGSGSIAARLLLIGLLITAVLFAFLLPLFAIRLQSPRVVPSVRTHHSIEFPGLHDEVRIETLDGQHRTIILESKSH